MVRRKVDELGRLVLPLEIRKKMNIGIHTVVNVSFSDGKILIEHADDVCKLCGNTNNLENTILGHICTECIKKIKAIE